MGDSKRERPIGAIDAVLIISAVLFMIQLGGCAKQPEESRRVNSTFTIDKLFTFDGCTVYRFFDAGRERYFTNCRGAVEWSETCGKNCTSDMSIGGGR